MKKICRIITDDKIGNINPAFALAEAISENINIKIEHITVKNYYLWRLFPIFLLKFTIINNFIQKFYKLSDHKDVILTIGNGAASIIPCVALSLQNKSSKNGLFVQLQNPRLNNTYFDYIVAPLHDNVKGHNVIPTIGSLSRVKYFLNYHSLSKPPEISEFPQPIIGVFIGGKNKKFNFSEDEVRELAQYLKKLTEDHNISLIITCSRRTGVKNEKLLRSILQHQHIFFPNTNYHNLYYIMMKYCNQAIVTCDSINMISDAITAGLKTRIYELKGNQGKFKQFYEILKTRNLLTTFDCYDENNQSIHHFDEAKRVAKIISTALLKI